MAASAAPAGVGRIDAATDLTVEDLEADPLQRRLEQPRERAVLGPHVLGELGGGVPTSGVVDRAETVGGYRV